MFACSVLVIDDEPMIRDVIQQGLRRAGFVIETAGNANSGMAKFDKGAFDLVITDVQMPDGDGFTVVNHIRNSKYPRTPVIGLSATPWLLEDDRFDRAISKPFRINQIVNTARALITKCNDVDKSATG